MKEIEGKNVLITGGAMGMGRALATCFLQDKAKVILIDINSDVLEETASELRKLGGEVYTYVCDVVYRTKVYEMANQIHTEIGPIGIDRFYWIVREEFTFRAGNGIRTHKW